MTQAVKEITLEEAFQRYEDIYLEMENDDRVQNARKAIKMWQDRLDSYRSPYQKRLALYEDVIEEGVKQRQESTKFGHINAVYYKPRKNVSWKSVALEFDPPESLIKKYTSISDPRVQIKFDMNGD